MTRRSVEGSCLCGTVRFTARMPSSFCAHCHCTICRRSHGAGYVTWFGIPKNQLSVDEGRDELARFASSDHGTRSFCRSCGSTLFCESKTRPDEIDIVLANMDAPIDRLPSLHVFFDDRAEWVEISDGLPRLGGESGMEPIQGKNG